MYLELQPHVKCWTRSVPFLRCLDYNESEVPTLFFMGIDIEGYPKYSGWIQVQLKGWRLHLTYCGDWEHPFGLTVTHFRNSKKQKTSQLSPGTLTSLDGMLLLCNAKFGQKRPCVFQINFCLWILLNATLPSKYFQGGSKRMRSSYLLNSYQTAFSTGKIFKMKDQQIC